MNCTIHIVTLQTSRCMGCSALRTATVFGLWACETIHPTNDAKSHDLDPPRCTLVFQMQWRCAIPESKPFQLIRKGANIGNTRWTCFICICIIYLFIDLFHLFIYLFHLFICSFVFSFIHLIIYFFYLLFLFTYVYLSIYLFLFICFHLSTYLFMYLSMYPLICLFVCLSVCLFLFVYLASIYTHI